MKKHSRSITAIVTIAIILLAMMLLTYRVAEAQTPAETASTTPTIIYKTPEDILSKRQRAWLHALEWCESHHTDTAINKVDRDGTPSYGRLQFKPGTFNYFMKRYELGTSTNYMDGDLQEKIVEQMIIRADVKWYQQFPDCTKKLGNPPLSTVKN